MTALRVGIAGLGTVGMGALKIIQAQGPLLAERCGRAIEIAGISARDKNKNRGLALDALRWFDDPLAMVADANIDVIVEAMGGSEGIARAVVEKALSLGKPVVTANKALIAHHGMDLATLAEKNNAVLAFEAAVAGGIPIIKGLRDGLAANRFSRVAGIMNGTCNYILTAMQEQKRQFDDMLKEAQKLGYAEAEPSFDIDGIDTAHKLAILASLAFGCPPDIQAVEVEGIRRITLRDIEFASELGYSVKLLGIAALTEHGLEQRVHPSMVDKKSPLASVGGVYNAIVIEGDAVGTVLFQGKGAGGGPTGSSIVADLLDIARNVNYKPFTLPVASLKPLPRAGLETLTCSYYLRLNVMDRPGVLAEVTGIFKNEKISLRSVLQRPHQPEATAQLVLTTHETRESAMLRALTAIQGLESVKEQPCMIRIESL